MGEVTFLVAVCSCIHYMRLSFSLQTNKIPYKLHHDFTGKGGPGERQSIWQGTGDLDFDLAALLPG
jgi:hypothetical protein